MMDYLWLILMGVVFVIWGFVWFRVLFGLRRISDARRLSEGAGYGRGLVIVLQTFGDFLRAPEHRRWRRQVFGWTALLFAIILLRFLALSGGQSGM